VRGDGDARPPSHSIERGSSRDDQSRATRRHAVGAEHINNVNIEAAIRLKALDDVGAAGDFLEQLKDRTRTELMQVDREARETNFADAADVGAGRSMRSITAAPLSLRLPTDGDWW
jgi:hypothetical protein